nr:immunoglobulin light chain junction region [Macaca mulatta]MOW40299.1 immunoglobulin light chain junction region [Macaca mulatta]
CMQSLEFPHTF